MGAIGWCCLTLTALWWQRWPLTAICAAGLLYAVRRWTLHAQKIVLTHNGLICRTRFGERRLAYRQIGGMRFARFSGDLLLERPWVCIRIPRHFEGGEEIRQVVSVAVWAHRGGEVPPDLAEAGSAFG